MAVPRVPLPACPIERAVSVVGGRWKTMILYQLLSGPVRYGPLRRQLIGCAERVFVRQVRELEADGVVERVGLGGNPPQVAYQLTPLGRQLHDMFAAMERWGTLHMQRVRPMENEALMNAQHAVIGSRHALARVPTFAR